jgi:hypothetical protein
MLILPSRARRTSAVERNATYRILLASWMRKTTYVLNQAASQGQFEKGALKNLGHTIGRSTIKRILREHGIDPAPIRGKRMPWSKFIKAHITRPLANVPVTPWSEPETRRSHQGPGKGRYPIAPISPTVQHWSMDRRSPAGVAFRLILQAWDGPSLRRLAGIARTHSPLARPPGRGPPVTRRSGDR